MFERKDGVPAGTEARPVPTGLVGLSRILRAFLQNQSGNYAIIAALASPILIGAAGLATEGGLWYNTHQTLQGAADSAALSAATQYGLNYTSNLNTQAAGVIFNYG